MTVEVGKYYNSLGHGISPTDLQTWEEEISNAESNRHIDCGVMDIFGARTSHDHGHVDTAKESACRPEKRQLVLALAIKQKQQEDDKSKIESDNFYFSNSIS